MLDSVVGTFLTQNAADVLSSAAFLNLTAAFPGPRSRAYFTHNSTALARQREVQDQEQRQEPSQGQGRGQGQGTLGQRAGAGVAVEVVGAEAAHAGGVSHWIPEGEDIVDWEAVRRAPADQLAELIRCR